MGHFYGAEGIGACLHCRNLLWRAETFIEPNRVPTAEGCFWSALENPRVGLGFTRGADKMDVIQNPAEAPGFGASTAMYTNTHTRNMATTSASVLFFSLLWFLQAHPGDITVAKQIRGHQTCDVTEGSYFAMETWLLGGPIERDGSCCQYLPGTPTVEKHQYIQDPLSHVVFLGGGRYLLVFNILPCILYFVCYR